MKKINWFTCILFFIVLSFAACEKTVDVKAAGPDAVVASDADVVTSVDVANEVTQSDAGLPSDVTVTD